MRALGAWINKHAITLIAVLFGMGFMLIFEDAALILDKNILAKPPRVVTVNITGLVNEYIHQMALSNLTPEQSKLHLADFSTRLQGAMSSLSRDENVVILPSQAVIAGAPDKTRIVIELMKTSDV